MSYFFDKYPALFYGISLFLGIHASSNSSFWLLAPSLVLLAFSFPFWTRSLLAVLIGLSGFCLAHFSQNTPSIGEEGIKGQAYIDVKELSLKKTRFGRIWLYKGVLRTFFSNMAASSKLPRNIPIIFQLPMKKDWERPPADKSYLVPCTLKQEGKKYKIQIEYEQPWLGIAKTISFAEMRLHAKAKAAAFIKSSFASKCTADFLAGLATGEFSDKNLNNAFKRFGLLHLMAISGFHFSILAALLNFLCRLFLSPVKASLAVITLLSLYFIFLGSGPSVLRAWMSIIILFGSLFSERQATGLNAMGFSLLASLILDPGLADNLGFQFSFLSTSAILLFYKPMESFFLLLFPKRSLEDFKKMSFKTKHGLILIGFFRSALALNAVTAIAAIPLTLFYFDKFPLLSLLYNLFFPFLVSISLGLLLAALLSIPIPLLSSLINGLNEQFTSFILNMTESVPHRFDLFLSWPVSSDFLIFYYTLFFGLLIFLKSDQFRYLFIHFITSLNLFRNTPFLKR